MIFLVRYWKYIAVIFAVLTIVGALFAYGHTQYGKGYDKCVQDHEAAEKKALEKSHDIKAKNYRAALSDIDKRLIADWLRND